MNRKEARFQPRSGFFPLVNKGIPGQLQATQQQFIQKEKMASLGELTAGIAHEIQNPLNFVSNSAEVSVELTEELREGLFRHLSADDRAEASELLGKLS